MAPSCVCDPLIVDGNHYSQFVGTYFADCVYSWADYASFLAGMVSIGFWLIAQFPQLYLSWKLGRVDALSKSLLVAWLVGDIANVVGCYLTSQLPTQLYTAWYFLIMVRSFCTPPVTPSHFSFPMFDSRIHSPRILLGSSLLIYLRFFIRTPT